ncbi:hypothetical protein [Nocardioides sp.]|uniref:hypothetical protein n=1 Tax=Nocardioides sp. TaxID=35761 RepID=UPI002ED78B56
MGRKARIALTMAFCAAWILLVDAVFDHRRPPGDPAWWAFYLGGLAVIGAVWMAVESLVRSRRGS